MLLKALAISSECFLARSTLSLRIYFFFLRANYTSSSFYSIFLRISSASCCNEYEKIILNVYLQIFIARTHLFYLPYASYHSNLVKTISQADPDETFLCVPYPLCALFQYYQQVLYFLFPVISFVQLQIIFFTATSNSLPDHVV